MHALGFRPEKPSDFALERLCLQGWVHFKTFLLQLTKNFLRIALVACQPWLVTVGPLLAKKVPCRPRVSHCRPLVLCVTICRRPRKPREDESRSVRFGFTTVQDSQIVMVLNLNQRVQIRQIVLRKQIFRKEVPNMDCFARYRVAT